MSRKIIFLLLCFLFIGASVSSSDSATLWLKAYKYSVNSTTPTKLFVIDSITTNPNEYEMNLGDLDGRTIDITSDLDSLLGVPGSSEGNAIFAYRVESYEKGPFTVTISFDRPFTHYVNGQPVDSDPKIGFGASLYNTASDPQSDLIKRNDAQYKNNATISKDSSTGDYLRNEWTVDNSYSENGGLWAARGSVSMVVNSSDYNSTKVYGTYRTNVTVKLEYGG